ncbi:MAG: HNH endonuclease signature motif containing protein [Candidatus Celaenobacter antarcticus]|nr:HNH endonuclease signature motif containing protein [Candidatus Celaenobacter antarcticus]
MTKRERIYQKFDGKCAYCGCDLPGKWHIDHIQPIFRGKGDTVGFMQDGKYVQKSRSEYAGTNKEDNLYPACPQCNIAKSNLTVEEFRRSILLTVKHLRHYDAKFRLAEKYRVIESYEIDIDLIFYFEKLEDM